MLSEAAPACETSTGYRETGLSKCSDTDHEDGLEDGSQSDGSSDGSADFACRRQ